MTSASWWHESFLLSLPFYLQLIRTSITQKSTSAQHSRTPKRSKHLFTQQWVDLAGGWEARAVVAGPAEGQQDLSGRESKGLPSLCSWRNPLFWGETIVTGVGTQKGRWQRKLRESVSCYLPWNSHKIFGPMDLWAPPNPCYPNSRITLLGCGHPQSPKCWAHTSSHSAATPFPPPAFFMHRLPTLAKSQWW